VSEPFVQIAINTAGPLPACREFGNSSIPADVLVQSSVNEVLECPVPTSLLSSVPTVITLRSTAVGFVDPSPDRGLDGLAERV